MKGTLTHYGWIDVTKLLMCFLVVSVHVGYAFPSCGDVLYVLGHASVPVFLVISGFFFGQQYMYVPISERSAVLKKYLKRIFMLYAIWTLVYCPIALVYLSHHHSLGTSLLLYVRNILFLGQNMMSWHLWYLHALMIELIFIHLLLKCKFKLWQIVIVSIMLFSIGEYIYENGYFTSEFFVSLFDNPQDSFFQRNIYVSLGMLLTYYKDKPLAPVWLICALASFVLYAFDIPFCYPMFSVGVVGLLLFLPKQTLYPTLFLWCRKASTFIYLFHFLPIVFMQQIMHWQGDFMQSYAIVLPVCLISAWIWIRLSQVDKLNVMKKFY